MRAFRVADRRHPIFDATGAALHGGRWNSPGRPVIYAAETYAGALLEVLVHANLSRVPKTHAAIDITIPDRVAIEALTANDLPGWNDEDLVASRAFGDRWLKQLRTAVLLVPSIVLQGRERNVLINPVHADFAAIGASAPQPVLWDERLFARGSWDR
jgi:RES domain-containing protein